MSRKEIRITGFGGQGVVLSGHIIGHAYSIDAGNEATMIQSFGPEARGSACSTTLVLSDSEVLYPYLQELDILVAMSGDGYEKYKDDLNDDGILVYEKDLVEPTPKKGQPVYGITSTRIAEEIGRVIVQNIVMLGFFAAVTDLVTREQWENAIKDSVPAGTEELNLKAFRAGWDYFLKAFRAGWDYLAEHYGEGKPAGQETEEEGKKEKDDH
jgi:2-oxoglutarate ferredoxin oxidoreductase subunit gamma